MKKSGFTLVEMLAVLVLVVAISVVIFPSIINYINSSKGDISNVTKEMILSNAKLYVSDNKNIFSEAVNSTYCLTVGDLIDKTYLEDTFKDSVSGDEIDRNKKIKVQYIYDADLKTNVFKYDLDDGCTPVYNSVICKAKETITNGNLAYGRYNYGDEYSCNLGDGESKTFYVLKENDDTVSLIMNKNIDSNGKGTTSGSTVAWCNDETLCKTNGNWDNTKGPLTALSVLKDRTKTWRYLSSDQITIPSAEQVALASGNSSWNIGDTVSEWLLGTDAYWTSSPFQDQAWIVIMWPQNDPDSEPSLYASGVGINNSSWGLRPVITIAKTQIENLEPILCRAVTELSTQYVYSQGGMVQTGVLASAGDPYAYGVEYSCELGDNDSKTFYVLENNDDTVSLIMSKNIDSSGLGVTEGNGVEWISKKDWEDAGGIVTNEMLNDNNYCQHAGYCLTAEFGPITANNYLKSSTEAWKKLSEDQITLPTYNQIYTAAGNKTSSFQTWLYENLNGNITPYGYWTSTPNNYSAYIAFDVNAGGVLQADNASMYAGAFGVRPVITIKKSNIKN